MRIAKIAVFLALLTPAAWIVRQVLTNNAGPNPVEYLTHGTGDWTINILMLTLAMTPLRMLTKRPDPIRFRRMLGLFAFFYGVLHFAVYLWLDKVFDAKEIWADIYKRPFITAGFAALVLMLPLALTSTKGMIRRLGGKRWQWLHRLIYLSGVAAVVHYWWLVKSDIRMPLLYAVILVILLSFRWRLVAALFAGTAVASAQQNMDLFLLIGQSNMAGRGLVEDQDRVPLSGVFALNKQDQWVPAIDPLHWDKPVAGVGLGRSFARAVKRDADVGLIPAAFGGTSLDQWKPGSDLYNEAVRRARVALKSGRLRGILWHQGEADSDKEELARTYAARWSVMMTSLKKDLNSPDVPVIVGELAQFLERDKHPFAGEINRQLHQVSAAVVSSEGLRDKGDKLHFDAAGQREFGRRYSEAYLKAAAVK